MILIKHASPTDIKQIFLLFRKVAAEPGGIARSDDEITYNYIEEFMQNAANTGVELIAIDDSNGGEIIAELHCYKFFPKAFKNVLSDLTIVVHPAMQGKGIGKKIFLELLNYIELKRPDILRVELIARESNTKAIDFYKQIGFVQEGRFEKRIIGTDNQFEADIPMAWFNKNFIKEA